MRSRSLLGSLLLSTACAFARAAPRGSGSVATACSQLQSQLSNASAVFLPGSTNYQNDIAHYFQNIVTESTCSVEPGSTADVAKILKIVGQNRVPFAVKGAGHTGNPGFSSSTGIQISMTRFNSVNYHASQGTADVGTGLIWDDVYSALEQFNVTVLGGRVSGIGVGGLTLGGGYTWFTNQYGLGVDNILAVQVVLPNGSVVTASDKSNSDLFWALKGGYNNFGIVTQITFKTIPVGQVWGGFKVVAGTELEATTNATAKYIAEVTDPKAALITTYIGIEGQPVASIEVFYDGPTPPAGIFDDFLAIPAIEQDISTRSFLSLVQSAPSAPNGGPTTRGYYDTAPISSATVPILNAIQNETEFWTTQLGNASTVEVAYAVEIFLPNIFSHASSGSSAYPPTRSQTYLPLAINFQYLSASDDTLMANAMTQSVQQLTHVASAQHQNTNTVPVYGNYAASHTWNSQRIFGNNLPRLLATKMLYDPLDVMGLTGGWKVSL